MAFLIFLRNRPAYRLHCLTHLFFFGERRKETAYSVYSSFCHACSFLLVQNLFFFFHVTRNLTLFSRSWSSELVLTLRLDCCTPKVLFMQPCRAQPARFNWMDSRALIKELRGNRHSTSLLSLPLWPLLCWRQNQDKNLDSATYQPVKLGQTVASVSHRTHTSG